MTLPFPCSRVRVFFSTIKLLCPGVVTRSGSLFRSLVRLQLVAAMLSLTDAAILSTALEAILYGVCESNVEVHNSELTHGLPVRLLGPDVHLHAVDRAPKSQAEKAQPWDGGSCMRHPPAIHRGMFRSNLRMVSSLTQVALGNDRQHRQGPRRLSDSWSPSAGRFRAVLRRRVIIDLCHQELSV